MVFRNFGENCTGKCWEDRGRSITSAGGVYLLSQALFHLALTTAHALCLPGAPSSWYKRENNHSVFQLNTVHQRSHQMYTMESCLLGLVPGKAGVEACAWHQLFRWFLFHLLISPSELCLLKMGAVP